MQQRFFSRMSVPIDDCHKEAVIESAKVAPNEKPISSN